MKVIGFCCELADKNLPLTLRPLILPPPFTKCAHSYLRLGERRKEKERRDFRWVPNPRIEPEISPDQARDHSLRAEGPRLPLERIQRTIGKS
jgi:hypothetical protein